MFILTSVDPGENYGYNAGRYGQNNGQLTTYNKIRLDIAVIDFLFHLPVSQIFIG